MTVLRSPTRSARCLVTALALTTPHLVGQTRVADLDPTNSSSPSGFLPWHGSTYFRAFDAAAAPILRTRLWRTDGTANGTILLTPTTEAWRFAEELTPVADRIFFVATDDASGAELWATDGNPANTRQVADIGPGTWSGRVHDLCAVGERVFFVAATPQATPFGNRYENNLELWSSDGTVVGTTIVVDLTPGLFAPDSQVGLLTSFGGALYFAATAGGTTRTLWRSDGTATGTVPVATTPWITTIAVLGQRLLMLANNELWISDGTTIGTRLAAPGPFTWLRVGDNVAYVGTSQSVAVWDGTQLVPLATPQYLEWPTAIGDRLFFRGRDPVHGLEPWISDGSAGGTHLLADIAPGTAHGMDAPDRYASPHFFERAGTDERVVFTANDGTGMQVWVTDGTTTGTRPITSFVLPFSWFGPVDYRRDGGRIFFRNMDTNGDQELWMVPVGLTEAQVAERYGRGCPSAAGTTPAISFGGSPRVGDAAFAVTVGAARGGAPAALLVGDERAAAGWTGCAFGVQPVITGIVTATDASGRATIPLAIPALPALLGARLAFQWAVIDPPGGVAGIATLSDGLLIVVGR